ncbi:MAG: hypothetical protein LIP01_10605 [Tannerellaceae bacterium]|nr:hypothetical protein [Tannerellaceae bacterium]
MKRFKYNVLFLIGACCLLMSGTIQGQKTLIDIELEPAAILIGEQSIISINVTTDCDKDVRLLISRDTLMRGVEVLTISDPDSVFIDNNRVIIKQDLLITSFDSSLYLLPPVQVLDGDEIISSNQVALKVSTVPVNIEDPDDFYDIKTVWKPPFIFADYYPVILGVLLFILLVVLIYFLVQRMRNKQPVNPFKKPEPVLPPHVIAIKELDEIKQQKLWQQGRNKEFYTQLTDTLRKYIHSRFGINAMEMTSGEIMELIRKNTEAESVYDSLKQILVLSDFVKFAQFHPLPDENNLSLMNAYLFVNQTKPVEIIKPEEITEEDKTNITNESL